MRVFTLLVALQLLASTELVLAKPRKAYMLMWDRPTTNNLVFASNFLKARGGTIDKILQDHFGFEVWCDDAAIIALRNNDHWQGNPMVPDIWDVTEGYSHISPVTGSRVPGVPPLKESQRRQLVVQSTAATSGKPPRRRQPVAQSDTATSGEPSQRRQPVAQSDAGTFEGPSQQFILPHMLLHAIANPKPSDTTKMSQGRPSRTVEPKPPLMLQYLNNDLPSNLKPPPLARPLDIDPGGLLKGPGTLQMKNQVQPKRSHCNEVDDPQQCLNKRPRPLDQPLWAQIIPEDEQVDYFERR